MRTERLVVASGGRERSPDAAPDPSITRAAAVLRAGGLVAFPTETVYGLGARADDAEAVRSIFRAKGRPPTNPLIVHVRTTSAARALAGAWTDRAERLAAAFWPGPLTLIVARPSRGLADEVSAGGASIALRVPSHPVAQALLAACDLPIAAPSANLSTTISPTTADHVMKSLAGRIDVCLDAGVASLGLESTIVDVTRSPAVLLRHGAIAALALAQHGGLVDRSGRRLAADERAEAPGGQARHYAPRARLSVVPFARVASEVEGQERGGAAVGALVREGDPVPARAARVEVLPRDAAGYAAGLYAALHRLDDAGCDAVVVAAVPDEPGWEAVRDRLERASVPAAS